MGARGHGVGALRVSRTASARTSTGLTGGLHGGVFSVTLADPSRSVAVYDAFQPIVQATRLGEVASLVDSTDEPGDLEPDLSQALDGALRPHQHLDRPLRRSPR